MNPNEVVFEIPELRKYIFSFLRSNPKVSCTSCQKTLVWDKPVEIYMDWSGPRCYPCIRAYFFGGQCSVPQFSCPSPATAPTNVHPRDALSPPDALSRVNPPQTLLLLRPPAPLDPRLRPPAPRTFLFLPRPVAPRSIRPPRYILVSLCEGIWQVDE